MDSNLFFLVFIPGLTVTAVVIGFLFAALALTQGEMRASTKRGLVSLVGTVVVVAVLFYVAFHVDHNALSHAG